MTNVNVVDQYFESFLNSFGVVDEVTEVSSEYLKEYEGKLPPSIIKYWESVGFASVGKGAFWLVDPEEYEGVLDIWLTDTPFAEIRDDLYVIARNAFGTLYVWRKGRGDFIILDALAGAVLVYADADRPPVSGEEEDLVMKRFFAYMEQDEVDVEDEDDEPMFDRALKKLGPVGQDEMYGYSHMPMLGGAERVENLTIVKTKVYHDIVVQMGSLEMIRI